MIKGIQIIEQLIYLRLAISTAVTILYHRTHVPHMINMVATLLTVFQFPLMSVRATLPSALNVINASSVGKLVQLVTASRLILYHEGQIDPMKDECHYQVKH